MFVYAGLPHLQSVGLAPPAGCWDHGAYSNDRDGTCLCTLFQVGSLAESDVQTL